MKVGDLVTVDSDCGAVGPAVIVQKQLYGFCKILFKGSIILMDVCFLEHMNESR